MCARTKPRIENRCRRHRKLVGVLTALRVTPESEQMGLDVALHGESIHS
jgi:hypothetical protein